MIPAYPTNAASTAPADEEPRFFVNDDFDAATDPDWWLDLGHVDLPLGLSV